HLTLKKVKESELFREELKRLKDEGWLDWQIVMALYNNINDLKANNLLRQNGKEYTSHKERSEEFQKTFHEIRLKDEEETYMEIPLSEIIGPNLDLKLKMISAYVLKSYGLDDKSRFPNFEALKQFLDERFRFMEDEVEELSPFRSEVDK